MADERGHTPARMLVIRRGLLLAGLAVTCWSVTRTVLLLSGHDVVPDDDRHGYLAIFSLVLLPVLVVAVVTLVADTAELWRRGHSPGRSRHVGPGVALALSAPLASPVAAVAVVVGVAIVVAARTDRP
ncbi:hypothetical protein [Actinophytocola glycyrrhizae]|uniref:Uncharacterized protein n=1 Tax=Actinophytocola glycyrrhizae TaxID=2044873 RepID=A0ABV9SBC9_9PSEU